MEELRVDQHRTMRGRNGKNLQNVTVPKPHPNYVYHTHHVRKERALCKSLHPVFSEIVVRSGL